MSRGLALRVDAGSFAPPRTNAIVAVLAFAGIADSVMQTLAIRLIPTSSNW